MTKRKLFALAAISIGACVFQLLPTGCPQFFLQQGLAIFDACSVLNCTSGTFFNFCDPIVVLVDCPNIQ